MAVLDRSTVEAGTDLPRVKRLRHRAEVPVLLLGTFLLAVGILLVVVMVVDGLSAPDWPRSWA